MASPDTLRERFSLPAAVPQGLLSTHLASALRDIAAEVGVAEDAPMPGITYLLWEEAVEYRAYALALPHLHTFSLIGASQVAKLAETLNFRFHDPADVDAQVDRLTDRSNELVGRLQALFAKVDDAQTTTLPFGMMAI